MVIKTEMIWASMGLAMGQLAEAVRRSTLGRLWLHHETARVVAQLFSRGAQPMAPEDLLALTAHVGDGLPSLEENAARRFWSDALTLWAHPKPREDSPASLDSAMKALEELRSGGMSAGELAMEAPLHFIAITGTVLPSISLALPSDEIGFSKAFPSAVTQQCQAGLERLEALERDFARWRALLPDARSDSRLEDTLVLLGTVHALTPRYVGDSLGLTRQASARLLKRLADFGIVRKATKRQRWLIYMAENAAPAGIVPEITSNERTDLIDTAQVDRVLEDAYAALDRAVRQDPL